MTEVTNIRIDQTQTIIDIKEDINITNNKIDALDEKVGPFFNSMGEFLDDANTYPIDTVARVLGGGEYVAVANNGNITTASGQAFDLVSNWNPRSLGDFADPARTHDTPEFQEAIEQSLITGRKFEWDGGVATIDGPIEIFYANTLALSSGQPAHLDFSNCRIVHTGNDYVFRFSEEGNNAQRPRLNITSPTLIGNASSLGGFYFNSWGGATIDDAVFSGFPLGSNCIWLHNNYTGDYTENFHIYNSKSISNSGTFLKTSQGLGTASFSRLTVRDVFVASTHEAVFDLSGGVYDSLFENIKGNPGNSTIFKMKGAMGGTLIRKINLEQTGASGVCFDVEGGFTGNAPTIDFTAFSYVGSGERWAFGNTAFTAASFGDIIGSNISSYGDITAEERINSTGKKIDAGLAIPVVEIQFQVNLDATNSTTVVNVLDKDGNTISGFGNCVAGNLIWEIGNNQHAGSAPFAALTGGSGGLGLDVTKGVYVGTAIPVLARDASGNLGIKTSVSGFEGLSFKGHITVKL